MIELSIIIPVYNSEKYIRDCLNSICKQIKNEVELILVNDGSKDASLKICKYFSKKYKNIKIINEKKIEAFHIAEMLELKIPEENIFYFVIVMIN